MEHFELKAGQVAAVVGINAKQLQNAVEAGYVRPSVTGRGRGSIRLYTFEDVVRLRVFDILVKAYGLEQGRAARMLSGAWPRRFTAARQTLVIEPTKAAAGRGLSLDPITIPLADIITETERRIGRVRKTYREKKRGRPAGWSKQMGEALSDVSDRLRDVGDEQISSAIAAHRAGRLGSHAFLDDFALAYHRAVAERLRAEPEAVLERARQNLNRWAEGVAFGAGEQASLEEWREILGEVDVERLVEIFTDASDEGQRLRSSSPFVGTLSAEERLEILAACEQRATV